MNPGVLATLLVVGCIGAVLLLNYVTSAASKQLNQKVLQRGAHQKGQAAVRRGLAFQAPVVPSALLQRVVDVVNAHTSSPAIAPGLYLKARHAGRLEFVFGNKVSGAFLASVSAVDDGHGTTGGFEVEHWTEADGIVARRDQIDRLFERVADAVRQVGGTSQVTSPLDAPRPDGADFDKPLMPALPNGAAAIMGYSPAVPTAQSCPACASALAAGKKFCTECGLALGITCDQCSATRNPGARFCNACGASFPASVAIG